jgi:uncharacterized protein
VVLQGSFIFKLKPQFNNYMKTLCFCFLMLSIGLYSQNPNYNDSLARKLGADEYGMKKYILVLLKTGSNTNAGKTFTDSCFRGHMENMAVMVKAGQLVVAGPLGKNEKTYRGIFILNLNSLQEAAILLQSDPAIKAKLLEPELYNWYGSAALPVYLETSEKIWTKNH